LDVVFVDGAQGNFDSDLSLTRGINNTAIAAISTPYGFKTLGNGTTQVRVSNALNRGSSLPNADVAVLTTAFPALDASINVRAAYAAWTESTIAPVPLPAGGLLLLSAFGPRARAL